MTSETALPADNQHHRCHNTGSAHTPVGPPVTNAKEQRG